MAPRGRGKFSKPSRGGGKHFSRDVQPVDKDGNPVGLWREEDDLPSSDVEEESSAEEDSDSADEPSLETNARIPTFPGSSSSAAAAAAESAGAGAEMTREERRAAAKAKKQAAMARRSQMAAQPGDLPPSDSDLEANASSDEDEDDLPANPNHSAKSRSQLEKTNGEEEPVGDTTQLSRREREAIEAQQAKERYMKLHAEGKTDEARADLARLALVREKRETDRLRKEAEKEEKAELAKQRAAEREAKFQAAKAGKKKGAKK